MMTWLLTWLKVKVTKLNLKNIYYLFKFFFFLKKRQNVNNYDMEDVTKFKC